MDLVKMLRDFEQEIKNIVLSKMAKIEYVRIIIPLQLRMSRIESKDIISSAKKEIKMKILEEVEKCITFEEKKDKDDILTIIGKLNIIEDVNFDKVYGKVYRQVVKLALLESVSGLLNDLTKEEMNLFENYVRGDKKRKEGNWIYRYTKKNLKGIDVIDIGFFSTEKKALKAKDEHEKLGVKVSPVMEMDDDYELYKGNKQ